MSEFLSFDPQCSSGDGDMKERGGLRVYSYCDGCASGIEWCISTSRLAPPKESARRNPPAAIVKEIYNAGYIKKTSLLCA